LVFFKICCCPVLVGVLFNSAIVQAAEDNDLKELEALVSKGSDVNQQSKGIFPLQLAIRNENVEMVRFLLDNGADPNPPNPTGENAAQL